MATDKRISIDQEMLEMFRSECRDNFDQAEDSLLALEDDIENQEHLNALFRALHTLKGVSNMMGLEEMGMLAHGAEELTGIFRDEGVPVAQKGIDIILKAVDLLKEMAELVWEKGLQTDIPDRKILGEIKELCQTLRSENKAPQEEDTDTSVAKEEKANSDATTYATTNKDDPHPRGPITADNLNAFLFFIEEELPALKRLVDEEIQDNGSWEQTLTKAEVLEYAARDLGFHDVQGLLADFRKLIEDETVDAQEVANALAEIEKACSDIKEISPEDEPSRDKVEINPDTSDPVCQRDLCTADVHSHGNIEKSKGLEDEFFGKASFHGLDDEDLLAFLHFLEEEYPKLKKAISKSSQEDNWEDVAKCADMIEYAAEQLGLTNLADTLRTIKALSLDTGEDVKRNIFELEKALVEELLALKQLGEKRNIFAGPSEKELSSIFVNRVITDAEAMNGRLKECADAIEEGLDLLRQNEDVEIHQDLFMQEVESLRVLYHFCTFYEMDMASEAVLILEDIYNRMSHGEIPPDSEVTSMTSEIARLMQDLFEDIRQKREPSDEPFKEVLFQAKAFVSGLAENQVAGISKQFLKLLDVSPGFNEVATPASNSKIAEAFKKGLFFYEIKADLDSDPEVAGPFMELGDRMEFITNETIYEGDRTEYNFLVASHLDEDEIQQALAKIFPDQDAFSLRRCKLRDEIEVLKSEAHVDEVVLGRKKTSKRAHANDAIFSRLGKSVEDVAAISSTVHHVVNILEQMDYEELLSALNTKGIRQIDELIQQLRNLVKADRHLASTIEELQINVSEVVTVSATELLEWLSLAIKNISGAKGINISVDIRKGGTRIPRSLNKNLKKPLKELIKACLEIDEAATQTKTITLQARNAGDSIFLDLIGSYEMDKSAAQTAVKRARGLLTDPSIHMTFLGNGFSVKITNCNTLVHGIIMQKGGMNYVVPVKAIKRIVEPSRDDISRSSCDQGRKILKLEDELVSVKPIVGHPSNDDKDPEIIVVVESQSGLVAYEVDEIIGQEQLKVMPLSGHLSSISGATGCTILGNGDVGIVLDI